MKTRRVLIPLAILALAACEDVVEPPEPVAPQFSVVGVNLTDLGTLGGPSSNARAVNNLRQVIYSPRLSGI